MNCLLNSFIYSLLRVAVEHDLDVILVFPLVRKVLDGAWMV